MTTAEACVRFGLDKKELERRRKAGMIIGQHKEGKAIVIPDDTQIIPSKEDIVAFLFQIAKFKNNPNMTISRKLCPTRDGLCAVMDYLYRRGFVGEYCFSECVDEMFHSVQLTNDGFNYILGDAHSRKINATVSIPVTVNSNIGLVNV